MESAIVGGIGGTRLDLLGANVVLVADFGDFGLAMDTELRWLCCDSGDRTLGGREGTLGTARGAEGGGGGARPKCCDSF